MESVPEKEFWVEFEFVERVFSKEPIANAKAIRCYSWSLNNTGLNYMGPLISEFFSSEYIREP